ncbi:MAG: autotransporter domain-containing protein [Alphaproteobacteria bacterium]
MKRILFGTSALGLTLAVLASAPVTAQVCDSGGGSLSNFVCDNTDTDEVLDLSSSTGPVSVEVQNTVQDLVILDVPNSLAGTDASTVEITIKSEANAQNSSIVNAGDLRFADIQLGENDDILNIGGPSNVQNANGQTSLGQAGTINDSKIHFGAGNDQLNIAGTITNNASISNANTVNMGDGDDEVRIISGGTATFSNDFQAGTGNDSFYNDGSLSGVINMGEDDDYFQNSQTFTGRIEMGTGNDEFHAIDYVPSMQNSSAITIDGGAEDLTPYQDPNNPNNMITPIGDVLRLDGSNGTSAVTAERIANFETLIKQGSGTWTMNSSTGMANTVSFVNGVSINDGSMYFDGMTLLSNVKNSATLGGDFKIDSLQDAVAGSTPSLHNTATGEIEGSIDFSSYNDLFVNDGVIRSTHSGFNNTTPVMIDLGGGSDTFQNSGIVSGIVNLGDDDDRFILEGSNLFLAGTAGTILGGAHTVGGGDTIELAGAGVGRLMQINDNSSQIREFENIDVTSGTWSMAASQSGLATLSVSGGTFNSGTQVSVQNLVVDGGDMNINSAFTAGSANVSNGTLSILNTLLNAPVTVGSGGHLHTNGTINGNLIVADGGEVSAVDHDQIGDFDVTGNATFEDGSTVVVNVDPVTGFADMINVAGFATIDSGATIEVVPTSALAQGQYFEVDVVDASVVNGTFNVAPSSGFTDYSVEYNDGKVTLLMGASFAPVAVTPGLNQPGLDLNGNQIYAHLVASQSANTPPGLSPTMTQLIGVMNVAGTAQAASDAVSSEFYNAAYLSARSYANHVGSKVMDRIDDKEWCGTMQSAGEANCRANRGDSGDLWGSLEVYSTNNSKSRVASHKGTTFAGLIGMDRRMGLMTAGLVGGIGASSADVNSKGSTKGFNASLGGYLSIPAQVLNIDSSFVYNYGSAESERSFDNSVVENGGTGRSTFNGKSTTHQFSTNVRLTQEYKNEYGLEIQPSVGLGLNYMKMPGFAETATGKTDLALVMEDSSHFDADAKIGVQVRMPIRSAAGTLVPEARANLSKKIAGQKMNTQAHFVGTGATGLNRVADFQIEGDLPDVTFNLGLGLNYELDSGLMIMGDYDFNGGSSVSEHKGSLGVRYDF